MNDFEVRIRKKERILTSTSVAIAGVSIFAEAIVTSGSVDAGRVLVTGMPTRGALVKFGAIELVDSVISRKTLARVRANDVDATRIRIAVMTLGATLLLALVNVCGHGQQQGS